MKTISVWVSIDSADPNKLKLMVTNLSAATISTVIDVTGFEPSIGTYFEMTNQAFSAASDKTTVIDGTSINGLEINDNSAEDIRESAQAIINSGKNIAEVKSSFRHSFPAYSATAIILEGPKSKCQKG